MADALFERLDADTVRATGHSRGPWSPHALHGGPVAILMAGAVEAIPSDQPLAVTRLTIELERPVPLTPLRVHAAVTRPGRKVRVIDVEVHTTDGTRVVRARALQQRLAEMALPDDDVSAPLLAAQPPPFGPDGVTTTCSTWGGEAEAYHQTATEFRYVAGSWEQPGPVTVWVRLRLDPFDGQPPSPLQRVCAAADFGNGVSTVLPFERFGFINPDLTIHLLRPAVGEWIAMDTVTHYSRVGIGMAESALFDVDGRLGRSVQSLLIDPV